MNKSISFSLVFSAGTIDRAASLAAAEAALDSYVAEYDTQNEVIAEAVSAVFDTYKGANVTMPTIAGIALRSLNAQPSNYKTLEKLVLSYIRDNTDQDGEAPRTRMFRVKKGVGGGVARWSDVPESK